VLDFPRDYHYLATVEGAGMIDLINWILEEGRDNDDLGAILEKVSERLVASGIPVCRTTLNMPTIDPAAGVLSFQWWREKGVMRSTFAPGVSSGTQFTRSPVGYLVERNLGDERWKLEDPEVVGRFPLFQELRALGITEYALQLVPFSKGRTGLQGAALSMATDRPGGFSDAEIEEAARLLPALSLVAYRIGLLHVATETLGAYLGPQTGARVLQGKIRRGDSQVISAALLLADLRGFTALVDRARGTEVVGWLNQHLECIGDAVAEHNGEVLKFLGDGILAVFPAAPIGAEHACAEAVRAAIDACGRNAALNARRAAEGGPALDLTIALHFGDVLYGNIGTARRLDFTVIGPAVNEVSRMEALGKALGRELLLSESIAHRCGQPVLSLGPHELRGVAGMREMYVVAA
jgi:adenylate cyclase